MLFHGRPLTWAGRLCSTSRAIWYYMVVGVTRYYYWVTFFDSPVVLIDIDRPLFPSENNNMTSLTSNKIHNFDVRDNTRAPLGAQEKENKAHRLARGHLRRRISIHTRLFFWIITSSCCCMPCLYSPTSLVEYSVLNAGEMIDQPTPGCA